MPDSSANAAATTPTTTTTTLAHSVHLPRITITYCTQCRWLLRAAWLQQELLSTFSTSLGEIALVPATGGVFQIDLLYVPPVAEQERTNEGAREVCIWERKAEGGFPEAKVLKQRVRDCVDPGRGLGHSDRGSGKGKEGKEGESRGKAGEAPLPPDLAAGVREDGVRNPLVQRMRPEVAAGGKEGGGKGEECEDCQ